MRRSTLAAVAAIACLVSACGDNAPANDGSLPKFEENIDTWSLPLDAYIPDPVTLEYAVNASIATCMQELGLKFTLIDPRRTVPAAYSSRLRYLFNLENAQKYGYRADKPGQTSNAVSHGAPGQEAKVEQCSLKAGRELDTSNPLLSLAQGFGGQAYEQAKESNALVEPSAKWRECMLPLGVPDLPESPVEGSMPTDSQRVRFGTSDRMKAYKVPISALEVKEAVADAKCRDESRFTRTLYREEVRFELEAIRDHQGDLDKALEYAQEVEEKGSDAIREAGGTGS
ncbi:hypothetical protein [Nocardioides sp. WS12]|uniref:hypothetical protein n=1 Tax=Nocardioides sp. WS12 TaxID=2486272 RepID=UPI0015F7C054|nr:hypothetical protein [Nocardioides sp. WS12]